MELSGAEYRHSHLGDNMQKDVQIPFAAAITMVQAKRVFHLNWGLKISKSLYHKILICMALLLKSLSNSLALNRILLITVFVSKDIILYLLFKVFYFQYFIFCCPNRHILRNFIAKQSTISCYLFKQRFNFYFLIAPHYASVHDSRNGLLHQVYSLK